MEATKRTLHPLLTAAAVSVIVFSGVGVAAITGFLPTSKGSVKEETPVAAAESPAPAPSVEPQATPAPKPIQKHVAKVHKPAKHVAYAETPALTPPPPPAMAQAPQAVETPKPLVKPGLLGTVESVREVEQAGDAKGIGAVGGGVA